MNEFMRNTDAFALGMEGNARLRSTVVSIIVLDRAPDFDVLTDRLERVARQLPMFRQRIVPSLPPAPPRWVDDPDFELRYHLNRIVAPAPANLQTVLELARHAAMEEFDHARPMWNITVVEGLQDGEAALLVKLHHSLADGIGGVQIAQQVFELTREPADLGPLPPMPVPEERGAWDAVLHTAEYDAKLLGRALKGATGAPKALAKGVRRPVETIREAVATTTSVYRTIRPINDTASPVMRERRMVRELGVHEVPKRALRDAGHAGGGKLNDAFLAAVTGGLRRYHERHGATAEDLRVTMPISIRQEDDATGGNRITLMRFSLPVDVADPMARIALIHERASAAQHEKSLAHTQAIAGGLNLLPRWYIGAILRHVDFLASDVPGVPIPVYVGGAAVKMQYAFGPTIGASVNVTLMTYCDTCAIGINADTGAIPDFEAFRTCLIEGFDEVLALAAEPVSH